MDNLIRPSVCLLAGFSILTGVLYPAAVTLVAQTTFPLQANGSLVSRDGRVVGSSLIGQPFEDVRYFSGRPSATSPHAYNGASSTGSNLGPSNPALAEAVRARVETACAQSECEGAAVPVDLVTTCASGLDPHISPAAALFQVARVAKARALPESTVRELVERTVEPRTFGVLGEPRVNVLRLNLALDELSEGGV